MDNEEEDVDSVERSLSASYTTGVKRLSGYQMNALGFQVPPCIIAARKNSWDSLFGKYSQKISNDVALNIESFEPIDESAPRIRFPMRKRRSFVQYWVNTGMPPYGEEIESNDVSETGSSLSERELTTSSRSSASRSKIDLHVSRDERKCDSSFSSVDTAAYIKSSARFTKKMGGLPVHRSTTISGPKSPVIAITTDHVSNIFASKQNKVESHDQEINIGTSVPIDDPHLLSGTKNSKERSPGNSNREEDVDTPDAKDESRVSIKSNLPNDEILHGSPRIATKASVTKNEISPTMSTSRVCEKAVETLCDSSTDEESSPLFSDEKTSRNFQTSNATSRNDASQRTSRKRKLFTNRNSPIDIVLQPLEEAPESFSDMRQLSLGETTTRNSWRTSGKRKSFSFGKRTRMHAESKRKQRSCLLTVTEDVREDTEVHKESEKGRIETQNGDGTDVSLRNGIENPNAKKRTVEGSGERGNREHDSPESRQVDGISNSANGEKSRGKDNGTSKKTASLIVADNAEKSVQKRLTNANPVVRLRRLSPSFLRKYKRSSDRESGNQRTSSLQTDSRSSFAENGSDDSDAVDSDQSTIIICSRKDDAADRSTLSSDESSTKTVIARSASARRQFEKEPCSCFIGKDSNASKFENATDLQPRIAIKKLDVESIASRRMNDFDVAVRNSRDDISSQRLSGRRTKCEIAGGSLCVTIGSQIPGDTTSRLCLTNDDAGSRNGIDESISPSFIVPSSDEEDYFLKLVTRTTGSKDSEKRSSREKSSRQSTVQRVSEGSIEENIDRVNANGRRSIKLNDSHSSKSPRLSSGEQNCGPSESIIDTGSSVESKVPKDGESSTMHRGSLPVERKFSHPANNCEERSSGIDKSTTGSSSLNPFSKIKDDCDYDTSVSESIFDAIASPSSDTLMEKSTEEEKLTYRKMFAARNSSVLNGFTRSNCDDRYSVPSKKFVFKSIGSTSPSNDDLEEKCEEEEDEEGWKNSLRWWLPTASKLPIHRSPSIKSTKKASHSTNSFRKSIIFQTRSPCSSDSEPCYTATIRKSVSITNGRIVSSDISSDEQFFSSVADKTKQASVCSDGKSTMEHPLISVSSGDDKENVQSDIRGATEYRLSCRPRCTEPINGFVIGASAKESPNSCDGKEKRRVFYAEKRDRRRASVLGSRKSIVFRTKEDWESDSDDS